MQRGCTSAVERVEYGGWPPILMNMTTVMPVILISMTTATPAMVMPATLIPP